MLDVTSRTLRFYEEKGIITSTQSDDGKRRQYNAEQIKHIKNVLILRSLGLSVSKINKFLKESSDLKFAILERKADILAQITTKTKELNMLEETLSILDAGGDIFTDQLKKASIVSNSELIKTADICTGFFITGELEGCYQYFSVKLSDYLPLSVFTKVRFNTLKPVGDFCAREKFIRDADLENVFYQYLQYEKYGLIIKYVFRQSKIQGLWLNYYEL